MTSALRTSLAILTAAAALPFVALAARAETQALPKYQFPIATVPNVADRPPVIDGKLGKDEYQNFAAITGMVSWGSADGSLRTVVPRIQQVVWYLGYDQKFLYIAMHSPNPPDIWPLARVKYNDGDNAILWDDHVEIQIAKERTKATFQGVGFYKLMANAKGYRSDEWYYNGTPGTEGAWSMGGDVKCSVTRDAWDMEMAIDIRSFDEKTLTGKSWVLQLLRADAPGGTYFAGWVGATWMAWPEFGQVNFDPEAPVFRFLETGDLLTGNMGLNFEVVGRAAQPTPVTVDVTLTDGSGNALFTDTRTETVTQGQVKQLAMKSLVPLTEKGNRLSIVATYPRPDADGNPVATVLYRFETPIIKLTEAFNQQHIAPWLGQRPKGDFSWSFAYWPSYGIAKTSVDVDFFGIKEELAAATAFEVSVARQGEAKPIASQRTELRDKAGSLVMKALDLPEGQYTARVAVVGADGKATVGTKEMTFVRKKYPWEGTKLGLTDKVIPPFTPIETNAAAREFNVWGRTYTIGENGLPAKIIAAGGAGPENILTGPIALAARQGANDAALVPAKCELRKTGPERVELHTEGTLGGAACTLDTALEYDGWYSVKIQLAPGSGNIVYDNLALTIPLWGAADTMYIQRDGDCRRGNQFGNIPAGSGVVWDSTKLLPLADWGSFTPIVFVGTGDKGLWWFADQNRDWTMADGKPAVELLRGEQGLTLKVNFFAGRTELKTARTLEFALLIDPVKQMADERAIGWGKIPYSHNSYGYRYYGRSVDGYENSDEDLVELNRVLTDPNWKPDPAKAAPKTSNLGHIQHFRSTHFDAVTKGKQKLVLYGSTWMTGLGMEEFDTFGGEWLGRTNWVASPQTEFKDQWNLQQTYPWKTPRDLSSVGMNFIRSQEDCFVWHHERLLSRTPTNGTWWDNASVGVLDDYDPATGEFYKRFNVFDRRHLTKRLATLGWEIGREPWWVNNMHVDWSWCQVAWHIENDFYTDNEDTTMQDQLPVDQFRALCRIKRGIIHRLATRGPLGTNEQIRRLGRSSVGMCLLHDIGSYGWGGEKPFIDAMLKIADDTVGFFAGAEFTGYWRSAPLVKIGTPGVFASVYRGNGKALIVVLSQNRGDVDVSFEIGKELLGGKPVRRIYDAETGFVFAPQRDAALKRTLPGEFKPGSFGMPDRAVRLIAVE